ncbi:MAG: serine protease, partial [Cyanobacteriota bacterium]|nr:serine protease [Cyanobacteriota bacterium]
MPSYEEPRFSFYQISRYILTIVLSVGLTVLSLRIFPSLVLPPANANPPEIHEVVAVLPASQT